MSIAAFYTSLELAHHSTMQNVDGLNFCVRDGYRCCPAALAAILSYDGKQRRVRRNTHTRMPCEHTWIVANLTPINSMYYAQSEIRPNVAKQNLAWTLVVDGLNTSSPWCLHPDSIKLVFYESPERSLFR